MRYFLLMLLMSLVLFGCRRHVYDPSDWDLGFSYDSVRVTVFTRTVSYNAGTTAEVTGTVVVYDHDTGDRRGGKQVFFCVTDPQVEVLCPNPTSSEDGIVGFTLRTTESAGRVAVVVTTGMLCHDDSETILFIRADRIPAQVFGIANPDTLYVDPSHPDSTLIQITVMDAESRPVPHYTVECMLVNWGSLDCTRYEAQTDSAGRVLSYYPVSRWLTPYTWRYFVQAGTLTDTVSLTVMPWDSTPGE